MEIFNGRLAKSFANSFDLLIQFDRDSVDQQFDFDDWRRSGGSLRRNPKFRDPSYVIPRVVCRLSMKVFLASGEEKGKVCFIELKSD